MRRALLLGLLLLSCKGSGTKPIDVPPPPPEPKCGDGNVDKGEACDLSNLAGATCQSLGFDTGPLVCDSACQFSTSLCVKRCGNGVKEAAEACDGDAGLEACAQFGYLSCTGTCTVDARHCVTTAFESGPALELTKGGPAVVGDVSPRGPGDLVMAVPSFGRVEAFPWVATQGFDGTGGRKLSFLKSPVRAEVCDVDSDGNQDVATVNADGSFDHYVFTGAGFALQELDGGCAGASFLGPARLAADGGAQAVAWGCDALFVLGARSLRSLAARDSSAATIADVDGDGVSELLWVDDGGPSLKVLRAPDFAADAGVALPVSPAAIAAGDLDGDGDADLAALVGAQVQLLENTGLGFAPKVAFPAAGAGELRIAELDLDGRPDVLWTQGDEVVIRRNRGGFLFSEVRAALGPGPRLSFDVGDVDGDGDPDFAATVSLGGDATRTWVTLNRVR
ncbi:MAG: VCBS repeat-containing protein [Myxococcales bacterium]|nr:VCBS repeat-containing protein [Myxococcales bacterium]